VQAPEGDLLLFIDVDADDLDETDLPAPALF
jgi:hypothetical protein